MALVSTQQISAVKQPGQDVPTDAKMANASLIQLNVSNITAAQSPSL